MKRIPLLVTLALPVLLYAQMMPSPNASALVKSVSALAGGAVSSLIPTRVVTSPILDEAIKGAVGGAAGGFFAGGLASVIGGDNFWDGAWKGAITGIVRSKKRVTVYNIEVAENHNYFVSPIKILVHNKNMKELEMMASKTTNDRVK